MNLKITNNDNDIIDITKNKNISQDVMKLLECSTKQKNMIE